MSWTEARVETLKAMWANGSSASEIATALGGISRNSVIGKVHRSGLPARRQRQSAPKPSASLSPRPLRKLQRVSAQAVKKRRDEAKLPPAPIVQAPMLAPNARRLSILDLTEHTCKFPLGDPKEKGFAFCGAYKPANGSPYCDFHHFRCYQTGTALRPRPKLMAEAA